jgi:hypothetical protein
MPRGDRQEQQAGSESVLLQAGGDIVISGLSAADVIDITRAEVARVVDEVSAIAKQVAEERVHSLGDKILERFAQSPEILGAFAEPDFQFSLGDAGRAAASNDDEHTEDLLVDLLANRAQAGNTSRVRLVTSQAIRAADKLSLETLNGLTALWAMPALSANNKSIASLELVSASSISQSLVTLGLPRDPGWVQEADALSLGRVTSGQLMTRKPFRQILEDRVGPHLIHGIPGDRYGELADELKRIGVEAGAKVAAHQLKSGYHVLVGDTREQFLGEVEALSDAPALNELIALNGFGGRDPEAITAWNKLVDGHAQLVEAITWWDSTPWIDLTLVGSVIGFVNSTRHIQFSGAQTVGELLRPKE